jgi:integrase
MKGCVFKRMLPSGKTSWGYSLDHGKGADGKRMREFKSGFERKGEAGDALQRLLNERDAGELLRPDPTTFAGFIEDWFREHADRQCSLKTVERYRQLAEYMIPHIGSIKLQDLTGLSLERIFNRLKDGGGRDRKTKKARPLSAKTVHHIAGVVSVALSTALRWKLIRSNPMDAVVLPKVAKKEARALDPTQLTFYLDAARACGLCEFLMIDAATGCRRGELLALTWADVRVQSQVVNISKSLEQTKAGLRVKPTKTERSRQISIPRSAIEILKAIKTRQEHNRCMFGADYRGDLDLVFCGPDGNHLKPDSVSSKCSLIAKNAGLKSVSLHTLRHSHGSLLLSAGVPLPTVSKRLGHSSPHVTAMVYSHALPKDEEAAAEIWDSAFRKTEAVVDANEAKVS